MEISKGRRFSRSLSPGRFLAKSNKRRFCGTRKRSRAEESRARSLARADQRATKETGTSLICIFSECTNNSVRRHVTEFYISAAIKGEEGQEVERSSGRFSAPSKFQRVEIFTGKRKFSNYTQKKVYLLACNRGPGTDLRVQRAEFRPIFSSLSRLCSPRS